MTDIEERPLKIFYTYEVTGYDEDGQPLQYLVVAENPRQARTKVKEARYEWGGRISGPMSFVRKSWSYAEEALKHNERLLRELRAYRAASVTEPEEVI